MIDNGSGFLRVGFPGEEEPKCIFPNIVGRPKFDEMIGGEGKEEYYGNDAVKNRGLLWYHYPIERGNVVNWDDLYKIWDHTYTNELRIDASEYPVHMTEALQSNTKGRETMIKHCFEVMQVPAFYVSSQAVLSLYASGNTTGLAIEIGDGVTQIVPVCGGFTMKHAATKIELAGRDLTHFLMDQVYLGNFNITDTALYEIVREMKEACCRVSMDYEEEVRGYQGQDGQGIEYKLPDGNVYELKAPALHCPELFFKPSINCMDIVGLHLFANECVFKCDIDLRTELYSQIN